VSVRIERKRLGDYRIGEIPNPVLSVAQVVATSSAFPPFLSPATLDLDPASWVKTKGADLYEQEDLRRCMVLTDGGVYDNIGLQALERCSTVLACDAGAPLPSISNPPRNWFGQTRRAMDIVTEQTRALRRRRLMDDLGANPGSRLPNAGPRKKGAYWRMKTKIGDFELPDAIAVDNEITASLQNIRTRLNRFTPCESGRLINWGYALADAAMRRHVLAPGALPGVLPMRDWPLD
jgi:NTE family protein